MTTIVGVDPSLSSCGLVTWRGGRFYVDTISTPADMPAPERHHRIVSRVLRMAQGPTLYVVEGMIKPSDEAMRGLSTLDLAQLRGVLNYGIHVKGHRRVEVHPSTLKVWAIGRGKASKDDMVAAARGRLGQLLFARNDDEADAAFLCTLALHHYGRPQWRPPRSHLRALTVPEWPPFTLEETINAR